MALTLSGTRDQAFVAAAVEVASQKSGRTYLGRTAIQKIVYFLQVAGVPVRYNFDIYHYGPFCDRVSHDVELLLADGVIKDTSTKSERYSNYVPDTALPELLAKHSDLDTYLPTINAVVVSLLPLEPKRLELIATLDFLYRQLVAGGGSGPWKPRVVDRFMRVKSNKFPQPEVEAAYDALADAKLISD